MKVGKIKPIILIAACLCFFCGCINNSYGNIVGYSDVQKAKELYAQLNSGHFCMQDNTSGLKTEDFIFRYNDNGNLTYAHTATNGDDVYYEYHNGAELSFKHKNEEQWSLKSYGDDDFNVYTREKKHPYTDEGVISVNAYAVTDSKVEEENGVKKITFFYNPEALKDSLSELGELRSFESVLWLNNEGYCYRLDQKAVFDKDGKEEISDYSLFIDSMNNVEEVTKPNA